MSLRCSASKQSVWSVSLSQLLLILKTGSLGQCPRNSTLTPELLSKLTSIHLQLDHSPEGFSCIPQAHFQSQGIFLQLSVCKWFSLVSIIHLVYIDSILIPYAPYCLCYTLRKKVQLRAPFLVLQVVTNRGLYSVPGRTK